MDFDALHEQLADLAKFAVRQRREESVLGLREAIERDERRLARSFLSVRQRVDSPYTGAAYAAWEIGKTIAALAGISAMTRAVERIEAEVGQEESVWLRRRWAGLRAPNGDCFGG